jgi:hypothetical protein
VFHQVFVCLVFVHGILANHLIHLILNFSHEILSDLAVSQTKSESRKGNLLCYPVDIEVQDLSRGPAIRDRPNLGSNEFLNNVTTTKDGAREVGHIFTVVDPSRSVVVGHSADSG